MRLITAFGMQVGWYRRLNHERRETSGPAERLTSGVP